MNPDELKDFMDSKVAAYNRAQFLEDDPLQVPRLFSRKEDIEISGFLTATIAWGNRSIIIRNAGRMMQLMDMAPYEFIMRHEAADLLRLEPFVHRTFNGADFTYFVKALKHLYVHKGGLEDIFSRNATTCSTQPAISALRKEFLEIPHPARVAKHLPDPARGSAAKRLNMFLRWMVRDGAAGVDFGIWKQLRPAQLSCPLDVHSGNVARRLGILTRRQNDARAVQELDKQLREWDAEDPVRYDFALFGLGVFEKWS